MNRMQFLDSLRFDDQTLGNQNVEPQSGFEVPP